MRIRIAALTAGLALVLGASAASAVPQNYVITGGEIVVTLTAGGQLLTAPIELAADGQNVSVDLTPGSEQVLSLSLSATGPVEVALTPGQFGVFDSLRVDSVLLSGGPGPLIEIGPVPPDVEYFAIVENTVLTTSVALIDVDAGTETLADLVLPLGVAAGPLFITMTGDEINMFGIAQTDVQLPGVAFPVNLKTDFNFTGTRVGAAAVPEPSAALVFAIGLVPIARALRRERLRRS